MKNTQLENALNKYINEDMIMVFDSFQELIDFINYDCPEIEQQVSTWDDVKSVLDKYVFYYNKKYYDIMFDEALEVRNYLPRGFFKIPKVLKRTTSYKEFIAFIDGMIEVNDTTRNKSEIINHYSQIIGGKDWVIKTTDIKSKMDFNCFKHDDYSDFERTEFVENLKKSLGLDSINIDDPKTWLPQLKRWGYVEDIGFDIENVEECFYDILERLYDGIDEYNQIIKYSREVIGYYDNNYTEYDELYIAFSVGKICHFECLLGMNAYTQKRVFEMVKKCWREFDGFSFSKEDYE